MVPARKKKRVRHAKYIHFPGFIPNKLLSAIRFPSYPGGLAGETGLLPLYTPGSVAEGGIVCPGGEVGD
jgi:hypothetical protein